MDKASVLGLIIGGLAIIGAYMLESGSILSIIQLSAALVVIGGSVGATLINFSLSDIFGALKAAKGVFVEEKENLLEVMDQIMGLANLARQGGILALQEVLPEINNEFLKRGTQLVIDTTNPKLLHDILKTEISMEEEQELQSSRVFEALGGFAPTFGIVGAVLGLIQVMSSLEDTSLLGKGIAAAFVATLYGVGIANLFFLPVAGKIKNKLREKILIKEMISQGLLSIQLGENPAIIQEKMYSFLSYARKQNSFLTAYQDVNPEELAYNEE